MDPNRQTETTSSPRLQVMICTYGKAGIDRVAATSHPKMEGVEYLVCVQLDPDEAEFLVPEVLQRDDFKIFPHLSKGLSVNRNVAISRASAPLLLISDDDVDYCEEGLRLVMKAFDANPDCDILTFRYGSEDHTKYYPEGPFDLASPVKGYFVTSFEIAFRRRQVQGRIWFNENFGIGATFPSGEEDLFISDALHAGLKGRYIPATICRHEGSTTAGRNIMLPSRPQTKGAVFLRLHPRDWPLRMLVHASREFPLWRKGRAPSPVAYCINWLKGVNTARRLNVFPTPDYSLFYPCHE